eukprot:CAMPEP_0177610344 /NCGR_PEP_ID=MMETSP0419_2-20121207/19712_1 /TAXON_ID=582737 /ORGANISM="Tetraselmis sp., Strain GSL018" /LENGTH=216 /DNA_ID=CAMNT_0019105609 /DNA_START=646 /DNA_END=1296 /DNA_ORIENTATION=-
MPFRARTYSTGEQGKKSERRRWEFLSRKEQALNPCNSPWHPAAKLAGINPKHSEQQLSVQEAYNPLSACFGCGPSSEDGLRLRSFRSEGGGLEGFVVFERRHQAFPGVVTGGLVTTAVECHGNWTAALALMDKACMPRPPLTLTSQLQVRFLSPVPPEEAVHLRSHVRKVDDADASGRGKATVVVEVELRAGPDTDSMLYAIGSGTFKKVGGARAM